MRGTALMAAKMRTTRFKDARSFSASTYSAGIASGDFAKSKARKKSALLADSGTGKCEAITRYAFQRLTFSAHAATSSR